MNWDLRAALKFCECIKSHLHNSGYLLTIYGSILCSDSPRDLDLMCVPWRPSPTPAKMAFDSICARFKLSPTVGPPYNGLMKTWSHTARDSNGRIIDFQFQRTTVTLEESYEFSMRGDAARAIEHYREAYARKVDEVAELLGRVKR